jgi:DNA-binding transcriptional ArsR family regulator
VVTFRNRQSSEAELVAEAPGADPACAQLGPGLVAWTVPDGLGGETGIVQRRSPVGGCAYRTPRNSRAVEVAVPCRRPLVVSTVRDAGLLAVAAGAWLADPLLQAVSRPVAVAEAITSGQMTGRNIRMVCIAAQVTGSPNQCSAQPEHHGTTSRGAYMLRVMLTKADLEHVRVTSRPAPMLELRTLLREPLMARPLAPGRDQAKVDIVRLLVAQPCAPAFALPAAADIEDAVETVAGARRDAIRRDLDDNATAGFPLPGWTADLTLPGQAGTGARHRLHAALAHVASHCVEPRAAAAGAGIRVVPTLSEAPGVTLSSDGHAPIVLICPVPLPGDQAPETGLLSDPALDELIGPSRSMLLSVIAADPGQGTRELARRTGLAPASVSEHARILRQAGLTGISPDGARKAHRLTPLGWSLLLRSADPA